MSEPARSRVRIPDRSRSIAIGLFALFFSLHFLAAPLGGVVPAGTGRIAAIALFGAWLAVTAAVARGRATSLCKADPARRDRRDLELGLLVVAGTYAALPAAGDHAPLLHPLAFLAVALLVTHTEQRVGFAVAAAAIAIEFARAGFGPGTGRFAEATVHALFIAAFSAAILRSTGAGVERIRRAAERAERAARAAKLRDARDFRLLAPETEHGSPEGREGGEGPAGDPSLARIDGTIDQMLLLLKRALRLNTCALLWLDPDGRTLTVKRSVSDAGTLAMKPVHRGDGVLGALLKHRKPLRLSGLGPEYGGLAYYAKPAAATDFIGLPILEQGNPAGVLCADRTDGQPFGSGDAETIAASIEILLDGLRSERMFRQLERAKSEQGKLLAASELLSRHQDERGLLQAALVSAARIAPFGLAAVALLSEEGRQVVREAAGPESERLLGVVASPTESLAAAALKTRHYLPYRGKFVPRQQLLLSRESQPLFASMHSALVLPLLSGDTPQGTLILASPAEGAFDSVARTTLQVMTHQLGAFIENVRIYQRLTEMATTDSLTGLPNHRIFQQSLDRKLASSARLGSVLSLLFCDVDHFKNVNDSFGHPLGDQVLKRLATILTREAARDTDLPARYGGEEFAILCEGTDTKGALLLAERIRGEFEKEVFQTPQGTLKVTISIGIATCPAHARRKERLLDCADIALYAAKKGGRNRVRAWEKGMQKKP